MAIFSSISTWQARRIFSCEPSGKHHALGIGLRLVNHDAHQLMRLAQPLLQLLAIFGEVDRILRHAGFHRGLGNGGRFPHQHARIERLGNDVVRSKLQALHTVGAAD